MRIYIRRAAFATLAIVTLGCGASTQTKFAKQTDPAKTKESTKQTAKIANANAETKTFAIQSGGHDVMQLSVPVDTVRTSNDGSVVVNSNNRTVEFWLVDGAKTVDEALSKVGEQIKDEFKNFKVTKSTDLTIAGAPAKRQEGSGEEADDGDDGKADVIVFKLGDRVFIACTHGEALDAAAQEWMLALVQSAKGV